MPHLDQESKSKSSSAEAAICWLEDHGDYLFAYAVARLRKADVAEDLVQETLLAAMESFDRFEERSAVRTWLTSILRHKLLDHWRKQQREHSIGSGAAMDSAAGGDLQVLADSLFTRGGKWTNNPRKLDDIPEPGDSATAEELRRTLLECLEKLPPRSAEAIHLIERGEMNLQQLSNLLGITTTHAGVILHRARLALRECLERNWYRT